MSKATMLTTVDNPFDPFTQWDDWRRFDTDKGYFTCEFIARLVDSSPELSDSDQELASLIAIYEIIRLQPETYKAITKEVDE